MRRLPECDRCLFNTRNPLLPCTVHPVIPDNIESCIDFRLDPQVPPLEQWEPAGAAYYDGELVLAPAQCRTNQEQLDLLDWHPLFTGRCPECEQIILAADPPQVHWDCPECGWVDDTL